MTIGDDVPAGAPHITVAAVCFVDTGDRVLTVRKRGTSLFMLPGGKLEPGESPQAAACRECAEEIGVTQQAAQLQEVGRWCGEAANEPGHTIEATVYVVERDIRPHVSREIEEMRWLPVREPGSAHLAPLLEQFVLPKLAAWLVTRS